MSEEEIKDIKEILELAKDEIENNDENITATLDLQDLKSLKNLYVLYKKEKEKNTLLLANNNYISKDKIREKIKELDELLKDTQKELGTGRSIEFAIHAHQKDMLKSLLEEK